MCGIIAGIGNNLSKSMITKGLLATQIRGTDATGVFQPSAGIIKSPELAIDFVKSESFKRVVDNDTQFIGHCRAATNGKPNKEDNNHPMMGDKWLLVHNGTVFMKKLPDYQYKGECDTEVLLSYMEREGDVTKALEDLHGTAAIVATNLSDIKEGKRVLYFWRSGHYATLWCGINFKTMQFVLGSTETIVKAMITESALSGLVNYIDSNWVISEVCPNDFWRVEFLAPSKKHKVGLIEANYLGLKKPLDNPLTKEAVATKVWDYRDLRASNYNGNSITEVSSSVGSDPFDCPESGFFLTDKTCRQCSLYEYCQEEAMTDVFSYNKFSTKAIISLKKCDEKFNRNSEYCRTCVMRATCSIKKNNVVNITPTKVEEKNATIQ